MIKIEKFTGEKTYMYPNGAIATPERMRMDFPALDFFPHILEVNGNVCQAVQELGAMRNFHGIDAGLTEDEAIAAIELKINTPAPAPEPTAEERIAAALEYQNLLSM